LGQWGFIEYEKIQLLSNESENGCPFIVGFHMGTPGSLTPAGVPCYMAYSLLP